MERHRLHGIYLYGMGRAVISAVVTIQAAIILATANLVSLAYTGS